MTLKERHWRLLDTGFQTAARNMAIDEAVMRAHGRREVPPTLRFYGWEPAAVSIGYFQSMAKEIDLDAVRRGGYGYVRRQTGGRMIFHHQELTYSVAIRQELLPGGVTETYRELSQGLLAGLRLLGGSPALAHGELDPRRRDPSGFHAACFDSASAYELTLNGKKAVGSAQTRGEGVILQHGSIPLETDVDLLFSLMRVPEGARERLVRHYRAKATSLTEALGRRVGYAEARDAMVKGFAEAFGLTFTEEPLTPAEEAEASLLEQEKYGSDSWNLRK